MGGTIPALTLLLCLGLLVESGSAAWSNSQTSGTWTVKSDTVWDSGDMTGGEKSFTYTQTIGNFTSWVFALYESIYVRGLEWWEYFLGTNYMDQYVYFNLTKGADAVSVRYHHWGQRSWAGFGVGVHYVVEIHNEDSGEWDELFYAEDNPIELLKKHEYAFRFYFVRLSSTSLKVSIVPLTGRGADERVGDQIDKTFSVSDGFMTNTVLTQYVYVYGEGRAYGWKDGENFSETTPDETQASETYWLQNIFEALTRPIFELMPEWMQAFSLQISSFLAPLVGLLTVMWGAFLSFLPYFPYVFLFWLVDAGVASMQARSIVPLGVAATTIFGVVQQIGDLLVSIGSFLRDLIEFW